MNVMWQEKWLKEQYPNLKRIVRSGIRELSVDEIVAELGGGVAVVVLARSRPHFHLEAEETYTVVAGRLALIVEGKVVLLAAPGGKSDEPDWVEMGGGEPRIDPEPFGEHYVVRPRLVHSAITLNRAPAVVEVRSSPPWSPSDHFEV